MHNYHKIYFNREVDAKVKSPIIRDAKITDEFITGQEVDLDGDLKEKLHVIDRKCVEKVVLMVMNSKYGVNSP